MNEWASKPAKVVSAAAFASAPPAAAPLPRGPRLRRSHDPVAVMLGLDDQSHSDWFYIGLVVAAGLHVAVLLIALIIGLMRDIRSLMKESRGAIEEHYSAIYDVDLAPRPKVAIPPPKPIEAPPEPAPAPAPVQAKAAPRPKDDPYDQPPPTPAQAAKVMVKNDAPDDKLDFTKDSFVTGEGTAAYGQQSARGTGNTPTLAPNANLNGVPGGKGTGTAAPPPPPGPDRSAPPGLVGGTSWSCPFPPEADADQVDQAVAVIVVQVRPDGSPLSVSVTSDPGHGFGRAARICALGKRYSAALDKSGAPVAGTTPPIKVRFNR